MRLSLSSSFFLLLLLDVKRVTVQRVLDPYRTLKQDSEAQTVPSESNDLEKPINQLKMYFYALPNSLTPGSSVLGTRPKTNGRHRRQKGWVQRRHGDWWGLSLLVFSLVQVALERAGAMSLLILSWYYHFWGPYFCFCQIMLSGTPYRGYQERP